MIFDYGENTLLLAWTTNNAALLWGWAALRGWSSMYASGVCPLAADFSCDELF